MKAGLYIRVSTDMQARDGESLAEQEATTQAFCNFRNIPIVNIYREEGKSGKDTNRPQFQKMLRDCKKGIIDTMVVKKIDRLSRSLMDFEKTISFFEEYNINLISIHENFDTTTAMGRAVIRIIVTFAQLEREQTSERIADVMKFRAEQGIWNGGYPPLGYNYEKELGLLVNVEESKIIIIICNKYIEFASYKKVADYLNSMGYRTKKFYSRKGNEKGGTKYINTMIARVLKSPVYIGKIKHKGELYQGKHQPIVSEDIYTQVQELIKRNAVKKSSTKRVGIHNFILEGLVKCGECGALMTPKWSLSHGKRYFYYECTSVVHSGKRACKMKAINAATLESLILRRIRMLKKDDSLLKRILESNENSFQKDIYELEAKKIILNIKLTEINNRARAIVDRLLAMNELKHSTLLYDEVNQLDREKANIGKEIEELDFKITQLKNRSLNIDTAKQSIQYFTQIYRRLRPVDKKILMQILMKDITYGRDYISINYYSNISDTLQPATDLGSETKLKCWPRVLTGCAKDTLEQNYVDYFNINSYRGAKGKYYLKIGELAS